MANNNPAPSKPRVLILGGVGFIGRNLVDYLVTNDLTSKVRVADKVIPQMAWLSDKHKEAFNHIEFKHANLINPKSVESVFHLGSGSTFDFVVNCAAETKYGQSESVYKDGVYKLSMNCAQEAAKYPGMRYVELSSSQMTVPDKKALSETSSCEPWTMMSRQKLAVEQSLADISGLEYIIIRPAIVYGIGDRAGITPRLIVGGVYHYIQEKMKMLWTADLKMNTVHVLDVCRAVWHLCLHGTPSSTYCLADKTDTDQGKVGEIISQIFNINYDYVGSLVSTIAKDINLTDIVEEINDKHMQPWGEACQKDNIMNTPLNPYLDEELLCENHVFVDGSFIETTGFHYDYPKLSVKFLQEVLDDYVKAGLFPPSFLAQS